MATLRGAYPPAPGGGRRLPLPDRERLVGDPPEQILDERELVPFGRERVDLDRQDLLPEQRLEMRLEVLLGK